MPKPSDALVGEARLRTSQLEARVILLAAVLVALHLLDVKPASIEALGATISLRSPAILRGGVAVVFLHTLYQWGYAYAFTRSMDSRIAAGRQITRANIHHIRRGDRTIKQVKKAARAVLRLERIIMAPYRVGMIIIFIAACSLAWYDTLTLEFYAYDNTAAGRFIANFF